MRRIIALCTLLALTACAAPSRYAKPVAAPEVVMEAGPSVADCTPGEGDGIGGTGCDVN